MASWQENSGQAGEPTDAERVGLKRIADITLGLRRWFFIGSAVVACTIFANETVFSIAALGMFIGYVAFVVRSATLRCPRCGGSFRAGKHVFDRHYPHDRCMNGCGLLDKLD